MRAINKGTISFGLVSIPIKVYSANSPNKIGLNMLSPKGNRVKQQWVDTTTNETVERKDCTNKGYEFAKGKFISFTAEELKALDEESDSSIEIQEFVPTEEIPTIRVEKSYLLGTDGGEKSYALLSRVMEDNWVVAIGQWKARGRDHLVAIAPIKSGGIRGLIMYQLFYQDEHRLIDDVGVSGVEASEAEQDMAAQLVQSKTSESINWSNYSNNYNKRLQERIDAKISGKQVSSKTPQVPDTDIIDLYQELKQSLGSLTSEPTASV